MPTSPRRALALLAALVLGACAAPPAAAPGESAAPATLRFMAFGDAAERAAYQGLIDAYQQGHAGQLVELTMIPSQGDYRTRLTTDFAAGTPPDLMLLNYRRYGSFAANGVLEPLGSYLDRSPLISREQFYQSPLNAFTWGGELTCIPQNVSSLVVYYNQELFDAAGLAYPGDDWTWDEFVDTAKALTRDLDGDGATDQYGLGLEPSLIRAAPFVWQNGGALVDDERAPTQLALLNPPAQEALQWLVDLQLVHHVVPDRVAEAAEDSESRFVAGRTAMFLNSRRGTPAYREIEAFTWDVAPLPRGKQTAGILHSDAYCMAAASERKEAAWAFVEYANSPEGQRIIAASGRTVPSLRAVAESTAFLDPDAAPRRSAVFLNGLDTLRMLPVISTWEEIERVAGEEIERAFYGDVSVYEAANSAVSLSREYFVSGITSSDAAPAEKPAPSP